MRAASVVVLVLLLGACAGQETTPQTMAAAASSSTTTTTVVTTTSSSAAPESTTTASPVSEPPGDIDGTVGFVGCSMSQNSVEGYESLGGSRMWSFRVPYGGGGIGRWYLDITEDRGRYWEGFDAELAANPDTSTVWLNLCTLRQNRLDSFESAAAVISEIEARIPGTTVYVSGQPDYSDGHVCGLAGDGGPEAMAAIADELVAAGLALPGPVMGPLSEAQTGDGCHAGEDGRRVLGQQLLDFFG